VDRESRVSETAAGPFAFAVISEFEEAHPGLEPEAVGRAMVDGLPERELRECAVAHIARWVALNRRTRARETEKAAALANARQEPLHAGERRAQDREESFQRLFDDPASVPGNARQRREFRRWAGARFGGWYERGRAAAEVSGERALRLFESDWHQGGRREYYDILRARRVRELIDEVAEETRLETTRELLSTIFALGDGSQVTWGDATAEQHEQRIEMLTRNAAGVVETAARHAAAVRMIRESGVTCLAQVEGVPAVPGVAA
jgi:hypothetical protein